MTEDNKYKILIIEDEALVARELRSRLNNMGYEVVGVAYSREGIELARQTSPDLLLTDIHLKDGEDGIRLAGEIQQERDVPVVFLTAYSDEATVSRAKSVAPYGYIIKPVENRELHIAIEMAIYKFRIERELRETQQLLQTALTCIGSALLFVGNDGCITRMNPDAEALFRTSRRDMVGMTWGEVLGLDEDSSVGRKISFAIERKEVTKLAPFIVSREGGLPSLVDGIVGPMEDGAVLIVRELSEINDPVEMLEAPDRLLAQLGAERLTPSESSMCQLLIASDGDGPLPESIASRVTHLLNQMLRSTDLVSRYGDSQIAVSMPYTSVEEGRQIAASLLKSLKVQDFEGDPVNFSIGLSSTIPGDQQPFELFRRASWALNIARESGGNRVIQWSDSAEQPTDSAASETERHREYHNLVLLWNVMNVVLKGSDKEELAEKLCTHLLHSFGLSRVALLELRGDSVASLAGKLAGYGDFGGVGDLRLSELDFHQIRALFDKEVAHVNYGNTHLFTLASDTLLYVVVRESLASSDVAFLQNLVSYLSAGFARYRLDTAVPVEVAGQALIYQSPKMQSILESVKLVGPTDATVLIVGESGTGKERLARAIHAASPRSDRPFIIVDCGAVVGSLIESELFGHVKGAFTGADRNFSGRLKEADGGTVLLDEVGELPLDVQVKLLRFVQEHEIAAVGSNRYESVDTRVIAATNRDLISLVAQGQFREDLYYRLNVFTIETPPLRERPEDILLLARHYLGEYAGRYGKRISGFSKDAEQALTEQRWSGNIRELMNVINRAVILCRDSLVSTIHLGLFPAVRRAEDVAAGPQKWSLESWLRELVDRSLAQPGDPPPLAQWLEDDLILTSLSMNEDVLNRAAQTLGIPESTLRRKVARLRESPSERKSIHGESIAPVITDLVEVARERRQPLLDVVSEGLLREIETRGLGRREAAALMGVSLPTYRKMLNEAP